MKLLRFARAWRWYLRAAAAAQVALAALNTLVWHVPAFVVVSAVLFVALLATLRLQARTIRKLEYQNRRRPDYAHIARMEREIYGEAFTHDGAPGTGGGTVPAGILTGYVTVRCAAHPGEGFCDEGFCVACDQERRRTRDLNAAIEAAADGERVWWPAAWGTATLPMPEGISVSFRTCENGHVIPGDCSCATCEGDEENV